MYDNQQQDYRPMLAIGLILVLTFLWIYFSPKPTPPPPQKKTDEIKEVQKEEEKGQETAKKEEIEQEPAEKAEIQRKTIEEKVESVDTDLYNASYSNYGATIKSLKLKQYRQKFDKNSDPVEMFDLASKTPTPLLWNFRIDKSDFTTDMPFKIVEAGEDKISFEGQFIDDADSTHLADIIVSYCISDKDYDLKYVVELINRADTDLDVYGNLKVFSKIAPVKSGGGFFLFAARNEPTKAIYNLNDKTDRELLEKQAGKTEPMSGDLGWLGFTDKYFMTALMPLKPMVKTLNFTDNRDKMIFAGASENIRSSQIVDVQANVVRLKASIPKSYESLNYELERNSESFFSGSGCKIIEEASGCYGKKQSLVLDIPRDLSVVDNLFSAELMYPKRILKAGKSIKYSSKLFAGPKEISTLKKMGRGMDKAIDLGDWIGPISRPLLYFLKWLYRLIHNYGVAIIILTIVVRMLMYPLTAMQSKSMKKMQMLKPEIDKLKAKYKGDKEALNREMMKMWKLHKVNPLGGCFPLLLQLPIFFALYRVLYNAIELRHAPFMLWIKDLSDYDPYFVTPILMGVSFFLQQKIMPQSMGDEAQQKMMKWMFPIMFTVLMLFLPAGLTLYIFVSTILGIVQQLFNMRDKKAALAKK